MERKMKYYTKEQETKNYLSALAQHMKKIPDKIYSDIEISAFYEEWIKNRITEQQLSLGIKEDDLVNNYYQFDIKIARKKYEKEYLLRLSLIPVVYPKWLTEKVDSRILALDLVPETAYRYIIKNELFQTPDLKNIDVVSKEKSVHFPKKLSDFCEEYFFSSELLELTHNKNKLKMILARDDDWEDGRCYIQIDFEECQILYQDDTIKAYPYCIQDDLFSSVYLLCYEIYQEEDNYEVHFLFSDIYGDLQYFTIICKEINIDWDASIENIYIPSFQQFDI